MGKKQVDAAITVALAKAGKDFKKAVTHCEDSISKINSLLLHAKGKKKAALLAQKKVEDDRLYNAVAGYYKAQLAFKAENVATDGLAPKKKAPKPTDAAKKM